MNSIIQDYVTECTTIVRSHGAFGEPEHHESFDHEKFIMMVSNYLDFIMGQRNHSNRKIEQLTDENQKLQDDVLRLSSEVEKYQRLLYGQYSKDVIDSLYELWFVLPACPLLGVVSGAIQELQAECPDT